VKFNGTDTLTADELDALKKATCVMVEFYGAADGGAYSSERIGSYSYTASQTYKDAERAAIARARAFLDAVGLSYMGSFNR
jgi:diphthamide biosynthesis methyltransferase